MRVLFVSLVLQWCTYRKACWIRDFRARDIGGLRANKNSSKSRFPLPSASISEYMSWISDGSRSTFYGFISFFTCYTAADQKIFEPRTRPGHSVPMVRSSFSKGEADWIAPDPTLLETAVFESRIPNPESILKTINLHKNVRLWWNSLDVLGSKFFF